MEKRGQATIFIILGIVLVVAVILFFVLTKTEIIPPLLTPSDAASQIRDVDEHVTDCLQEVGIEYVNILGAQGGYLNPGPDTFRMYNDSQVSYLCWNQEGLPTCTNRLLTVSRMEEDLTDAISQGLQTCINVYDVSQDIQAEEDWELEVDIAQENVVLTLFYPVEVAKGSDIATEDEFVQTLDVPLGNLYDVSQDIVNQHAVIGDFDPLLYMLEKLSQYTIYKNKPYPDVIYQVKEREHSFVFQFGIQGEENV
jgi:hypothetical protein